MVTDTHTHPQTPPTRPLQTVAYLGFQKSVPLPSRPSLLSPPFMSYVQCTVTACIMYINYRSSMTADVSFVSGLLLDTFQLQVNRLNVKQFLLCSLTQTVGLCNAHQILLLFCCNRTSSYIKLLLSPEPVHLSVVSVSWFSAVLAPPVRLFSSLTLHHWLPSYATHSNKQSISDELL